MRKRGGGATHFNFKSHFKANTIRDTDSNFFPLFTILFWTWLEEKYHSGDKTDLKNMLQLRSETPGIFRIYLMQSNYICAILIQTYILKPITPYHSTLQLLIFLAAYFFYPTILTYSCLLTDTTEMAAVRSVWWETRDPIATLDKLGSRTCLERHLLIGLCKRDKTDYIGALSSVSLT